MPLTVPTATVDAWPSSILVRLIDVATASVLRLDKRNVTPITTGKNNRPSLLSGIGISQHEV